ncbi:MAG: Asp-tRNA(Asn)/Glu-tRNA(Gln) amidotransferase subunit GatA [Bacteroidetes bacterium]|nr:Asp-tRNA(Asn)/Glu-tRNA(Gln) amidotransferase subunit GatA [Bacteroidota bacterium]
MFQFHSVEQYHAQLRAGHATCVQAAEHYLQQISDKQHLNAFIDVYSEEMLTRARALDEQRLATGKMGRLHGVIIGIKDVLCYKNHRVSASSRILQGYTAIYSATAVERLLAEEALIIGNLNCDEFAMGSTNENSAYGNVLNALDETRVPGGSSGGSAVAVQAGLCMLSLGSDTGGSVRQPADFCGITGLKPSYGRISRYGLIAYASSFDQIGIFGTQIPDIALLLEIMAGADEYDSTVSDKAVPAYATQLEPGRKFRFAFFDAALNHPGLDPEIGTAIKEKADELRQQGHQVDEVPFDLLEYIVPAYYVLTTAEASSNLARFDGVKYGYRTPEKNLSLTEFYKKNRSEGFGVEVKRRIMLGTFVLSAGYYDAYFTRAQKVRQLLCSKTASIFQSYDFIMMPTSPVTAFKTGEKMGDPIAMYLADIYTVMANLVGCPAISIPLFQHSNGMPFGLQLMANRFDEVSLLQVSNLLLQAKSV